MPARLRRAGGAGRRANRGRRDADATRRRPSPASVGAAGDRADGLAARGVGLRGLRRRLRRAAGPVALGRRRIPAGYPGPQRDHAEPAGEPAAGAARAVPLAGRPGRRGTGQDSHRPPPVSSRTGNRPNRPVGTAQAPPLLAAADRRRIRRRRPRRRAGGAAGRRGRAVAAGAGTGQVAGRADAAAGGEHRHAVLRVHAHRSVCRPGRRDRVLEPVVGHPADSASPPPPGPPRPKHDYARGRTRGGEPARPGGRPLVRLAVRRRDAPGGVVLRGLFRPGDDKAGALGRRGDGRRRSGPRRILAGCRAQPGPARASAAHSLGGRARSAAQDTQEESGEGRYRQRLSQRGHFRMWHVPCRSSGARSSGR